MLFRSHMVAYSIDPKEAYLTEKGIQEIKSTLAKDIFRQDLISIYDRYNRYRNDLRAGSRSRIAEIIKEINANTFENEYLEELLIKLCDMLKRSKGKKQYGYLSPSAKKIVDDIVIELSKDKRISELYDLWYEEKENTIRIYTDNMPNRIPLVDNPEFKSVKNAVIKEAMNIVNEGGYNKSSDSNAHLTVRVMNLLYYISNMFLDDIDHDHPAKIDRKQLQKINEKKIAQGMKLE